MTADPSPPWWQDYFSHLYGALYRGPLAPDLDQAAEVALLRRIFADAAAPVLDIGCAYGRHLRPLRTARIPAVGIDLTAALLHQAPHSLRNRLLRADMRRLPFLDRSLAGAYMLFNTFGYFPDAENRDLLGEIARVLAPGARLLMEVPLRAGMRQAVKDTPAAVRIQGKARLQEAWRFNGETNRLEAKGRWEWDGDVQEWRLEMRVYTPGELVKLVRRAGFADPVEIRPLEERDAVGRGDPGPGAAHPALRTATHAVVLATMPR